MNHNGEQAGDGSGERWLYLSNEYRTIMIMVEQGRVRAAPPIARRFTGKQEEEVVKWMRKGPGFYMTEIPHA